MRLNKKGFTLTELLIALGVIGILSAILLPVISNMLPDQNALMAKRAYYTVQNIVSDLINDDLCYPDTSRVETESLRRLGFDDGYKYENCTGWQLTDADYNEDGTLKVNEDGNPNEENADQKFITLFKNLVDIKSDSGNEFTSKDGIAWKFVVQDDENNFNKKKQKDTSHIVLYVDVNGDKKPNRRENNDHNNDNITIMGNSKTKGNSSSYDNFSMNIYETGKIEINDTWAKNAVDINKDITGENKSNSVSTASGAGCVSDDENNKQCYNPETQKCEPCPTN